MRTKKEIASGLATNAVLEWKSNGAGGSLAEHHQVIVCMALSFASEIERLEQQIEELKKDKLDKPTTKDIEVAKVLGLI